MSKIHIEFTRFSAFYSPLISTISGEFLAEEGLEPTYSIAAPGKSAITSLVDGSAHVVQSALSQGLLARERGETPPALHFAQINERDGFFLAAREPDPEFRWSKLAGKKVLVDHGGQPLAMFKYACHRMGVDYETIEAIDAGDTDAMVAAFRDGAADYIHLQGPAPQQLEHDGVAHVVAQVGDAVGPCGFSSLAATSDWLRSEMARLFMRAYRRTRTYINDTAPGAIAEAEASFFPHVDRAVLARTIETYQSLGCWTPHVEITPAAYDATVDVFMHVGAVTTRHPYAEVCAPPPQ